MTIRVASDWRRDAIATMAGLLMAWGASPYDHWWLSVAALAVLCGCCAGIGTVRAFRLTFLFGLAQFGVMMYLIYRGTENSIDTPTWLRAVTATALVFFQALFPAIAVSISLLLAQRSRSFLFYVFFPALWALFDSARHMTVYEFPWDWLGYVYRSPGVVEFKIILWVFVSSLFTVTIAAVASATFTHGLRAIRRRRSY
jgi:apolipoprotein N-acyltransferase